MRAALCTASMVDSYWLTIALKYLHARTAALLVFGPSSADSWQLSPGCLSLLLRRPGRFCARCRCTSERYLGLAPLERVAGGRGLATSVYPPSIKEVDTWQRQDFLLWAGLGYKLVRCAPCTVLKAGTHMWERVCDQPRRHTGQLRGMGDSEQGSIYVELLGLF